MGAGDDLIATGMARGADRRGKRIAFGDGTKIIWGPFSKMIFANNPNILSPGLEKARDAEWIHYCKGHRIYNSLSFQRDRWEWNYKFRVTPGEMFFDDSEKQFAAEMDSGFVLVEPNVPSKSGVSSNKQWPVGRYQSVADALGRDVPVVQLDYPGSRHSLAGVRRIRTETFRHALLAMSQAALYVGPEGGLHHGAAAVGTKAVVLFGGWIPPQSMGYDDHVNLTGGETEFCGLLRACSHCMRAMDRIGVDEVVAHARSLLL